ncbi:hypothetical protein WN943_014060 [Citrus x changshan-huyou]
MLVAKQPTERVFDQAIKKLPSQTPPRCYIPARLFEDIQSADLLKKAGVAAARVKSEVEKSGDTTFKALETYGRDRVEQAGKLDPVIGCNEEIRRAVHILSRRTINNLFLLQSGGLLDHDPPPPLMLDHDPSPPRLLDHELSPMIFQVMTQVHWCHPTEYKKYVEKDAAFERRFQQDRALVDAAHLSAHYIAAGAQAPAGPMLAPSLQPDEIDEGKSIVVLVQTSNGPWNDDDDGDNDNARPLKRIKDVDEI